MQRKDSWAAEGNKQREAAVWPFVGERRGAHGGAAKPRSLRSALCAAFSPVNTLHFHGFLPSGPRHPSVRSRRGRTCQRPLAAAAAAQRWPGTWGPSPSPEPSGLQQPAAERPGVIGPAAPLLPHRGPLTAPRDPTLSGTCPAGLTIPPPATPRLPALWQPRCRWPPRLPVREIVRVDWARRGAGGGCCRGSVTPPSSSELPAGGLRHLPDSTRAGVEQQGWGAAGLRSAQPRPERERVAVVKDAALRWRKWVLRGFVWFVFNRGSILEVCSQRKTNRILSHLAANKRAGVEWMKDWKLYRNQATC